MACIVHIASDNYTNVSLLWVADASDQSRRLPGKVVMTWGANGMGLVPQYKKCPSSNPMSPKCNSNIPNILTSVMLKNHMPGYLNQMYLSLFLVVFPKFHQMSRLKSAFHHPFLKKDGVPTWRRRELWDNLRPLGLLQCHALGRWEMP